MTAQVPSQRTNITGPSRLATIESQLFPLSSTVITNTFFPANEREQKTVCRIHIVMAHYSKPLFLSDFLSTFANFFLCLINPQKKSKGWVVSLVSRGSVLTVIRVLHTMIYRDVSHIWNWNSSNPWEWVVNHDILTYVWDIRWYTGTRVGRFSCLQSGSINVKGFLYIISLRQ